MSYRLVTTKAFIIVTIILFPFLSTTLLAKTCKKIGIATQCDDGSTYRKVGDTVYGSNGKKYTGIGNMKEGGVVYGSDGKKYRATPDTFQGSDGITCTRI
jgi:hypothetical protein